jgi:glutamine synthetase adenylyltransferase
VVADAIRSLREAGILPEGEAADLLEAHRFQRRVENHYQLMEDWISREISRESPMLNRLARSLGYPESTQGEARRAFLHDWDRTAACVRRYVERYFYASG